MRATAREAAGISPDAALIDCDVHVPAPGFHQLRPYLAEHWVEHFSRTGFDGRPASVAISYPPGAPTTKRPEVTEADSVDAACDLLRRYVLDEWKAEYAILNCVGGVESIQHPDIAEAISRATNDWMIENWLSRDSRLRASIIVPPHYPELAAREVERVGDHPGFVQVLLPVRSSAPYGNRRFHPLFQEVTERRLVVGLHFGGHPVGGAPTGVGWTSHYVEEYTGMAQIFQSQLMSLIFEGVFDQFPSIRVALLESGFSWLPAWLWRLDQDWRNLRRDTPWVRRPPTEYVCDQVRLTIQPYDGPMNARDLSMLLNHLPAEVLMFSTDYPHLRDDACIPDLRACMEPVAFGAMLAGVASALYDLELGDTAVGAEKNSEGPTAIVAAPANGVPRAEND